MASQASQIPLPYPGASSATTDFGLITLLRKSISSYTACRHLSWPQTQTNESSLNKTSECVRLYDIIELGSMSFVDRFVEQHQRYGMSLVNAWHTPNSHRYQSVHRVEREPATNLGSGLARLPKLLLRLS